MPVVTLRMSYPVGIAPVVGSALTAAGRICFHVPGVPAAVQVHTPPKRNRGLTSVLPLPWAHAAP